MATGAEAAAGQTPPPRPPALPRSASSACEPHRACIGAQVQLGRNAQAIYQDLVDRFGFEHRYNSVKRFVRRMKVRDPERFDVLESLPGEEAQVDFGQGALTLKSHGKYGRPYLFVMTLKYSGKSFRKVAWSRPIRTHRAAAGRPTGRATGATRPKTATEVLSLVENPSRLGPRAVAPTWAPAKRLQ